MKKWSEIKEALAGRLQRLRQEKARRHLAAIADRFPGLLVEKARAEIQALAVQMAERAVMAHLEREGLIHCRYCSRRYPLAVIGGWHVCQGHVSKALNEKREREPAAAAK